MKKKYIALILGALVIAGVAVYLISYSNKYYPETKIDNINVAGLTVSQAENKLKDNFNAKTLTLKTKNGNIKIKVSEIATYSPTAAKKVMENKGFLIGSNHKDTSSISYDKNKLKTWLQTQDVLWQGRVKTVDASSTYDSSKKQFVVVKETYGTEFTSLDKLTDQILSQLKNEVYTINVESSKYYKQPSVKIANMSATVKKLNSYANKTITLTDDDTTYTLTADEFAPHLSASGTTISLDENWLKTYVSSLASKVNTQYKATTIQLPGGGTINVSGGTYGKSLMRSTEREQLKKDILSGKNVKRALNIKMYGNKTLGSTFIVVNIASQTVTAYKNGSQILSASVVTGKPTADRMTHKGMYYIFHKRSPAVLKGADYSSNVDFFAAFHNGEGFHNAPWRSAFGGQIYKSSGSHGCVNMTYNDAKVIYNNFDIGTPVAVI